MPERPVLTARWRELLLLNFDVPTSAIEPLAPLGTEPDLHNGQAHISIVGFRFHDARLFGVPFPAHTHFDEINLRFYVRREVDGQTRRGVVFIREIVPRWAVAVAANWLYNENYIARPMRSRIHIAGAELNSNDTIEYAWRTGSRWNRLAARVAAPLAVPPSGSLEQFFVEHYWGYARGRDGATREYHVTHTPWRVAPVDDVIWDCDLPATYNTPLAEYLTAPPTTALIADGSTVELSRGRRLQ